MTGDIILRGMIQNLMPDEYLEKIVNEKELKTMGVRVICDKIINLKYNEEKFKPLLNAAKRASVNRTNISMVENTLQTCKEALRV